MSDLLLGEVGQRVHLCTWITSAFKVNSKKLLLLNFIPYIIFYK